MFDEFFPIIASSMQTYVYTIISFSEMSLPGSDIFPDLIVLISLHERSADHIPIFFELTLQATKPRTLVDGIQYF